MKKNINWVILVIFLAVVFAGQTRAQNPAPQVQSQSDCFEWNGKWWKWINVKDGKTVPCKQLLPAGAKFDDPEQNHATIYGATRSFGTYVRVPCEEGSSSTTGGVKTASSSAAIGGAATNPLEGNFLPSTPAFPETQPAKDLFQVGVGYNFMRTDKEDVKNLNGFQVAGFYNVNSWLAVGGEFSGLFGTATRHYSMVNEDISLDRYLYLFGPQVTFHPIPQVPQIQLVGHVLAGGVHDENEFRYSGMTHRSSANAFAMTVGGGVDVQVTRQITIGPVFDYTPTAFPASNGHNWQNNWRVGVVGKFSF